MSLVLVYMYLTWQLKYLPFIYRHITITNGDSFNVLLPQKQKISTRIESFFWEFKYRQGKIHLRSGWKINFPMQNLPAPIKLM